MSNALCAGSGGGGNGNIVVKTAAHSKVLPATMNTSSPTTVTISPGESYKMQETSTARINEKPTSGFAIGWMWSGTFQGYIVFQLNELMKSVDVLADDMPITLTATVEESYGLYNYYVELKNNSNKDFRFSYIVCMTLK